MRKKARVSGYAVPKGQGPWRMMRAISNGARGPPAQRGGASSILLSLPLLAHSFTR